MAWHYSMFDWAGLLTEGILEPVRSGRPVAFRPPGWEAKGRPGFIDVPSGTRLLIVEGVGSGRRALGPLLDAIVWVQSDLDVTLTRDRVRLAAGEGSPNLYVGWMQQEPPFQAAERPWERAAAIVAGTPSIPHDATIEVVVGE